MSHGQVRSGWPLNLELREWVLAALIFLKYPGRWGPVVTRSSPIRPTPYTISRFINSPVWPVEKSLRSLVKAGYVLEDFILPHNAEEARKLGQQIERMKPRIPPRRYWHYYYYATPEGEDYLQDQLMVPVN